MDSQTDISRDRTSANALYAKLEDRCMMRDQRGASDVYYDLIRAGRPLNEIILEGVRIHAPYTHVPYHERIDDGYPNFVNNDHCLLSARATINLMRLMPDHLKMLPMAQTIWYIPTGLDIWNQKLDLAPGHYTRHRGNPGEIEPNPPAPVAYWPDQAPLRLNGPLKERLGEWMNNVHRGNVIDAYRIFLGNFERADERKEVLQEMCFAGLIDVQDRILHNRSYTTGHKAYRTRSTVELGNEVGWENAHNIVYAGALDVAVGPRWYSTYEYACNYIKMFVEGEVMKAVPYAGVGPKELEALKATGPVPKEDSDKLIQAITRGREIDAHEQLTRMIKAGQDPRRIVDVLQLAVGQIVLETRDPNWFNMPHHCYEYHNTLAWFWDNFDHPRRLRLLYVAASFANRVAECQAGLNDSTPFACKAPAGADKLTADQLLDRVENAIVSLNMQECVDWTQAYCENVSDKMPLVRKIALAACRLGNDPHNQEIAQCMLMDWTTNRHPNRDLLLLAASWHTAGHRKYGDPQDPSRRFGKAFGYSELV